MIPQTALINIQMCSPLNSCATIPFDRSDLQACLLRLALRRSHSNFQNRPLKQTFTGSALHRVLNRIQSVLRPFDHAI